MRIRDWGLRFGIRIVGWGLEKVIEIIRDWDWGLELKIGIENQDWGFGMGD